MRGIGLKPQFGGNSLKRRQEISSKGIIVAFKTPDFCYNQSQDGINEKGLSTICINEIP